MTKLQAVQLIFDLCGKLPPKALDTSGASMASLAERTLDLVEQNIQSEGWHPNREEQVELTPDTEGRVAVPSDVLEIDADDSGRRINVTQRGGFLYDLDKNTFTFDGPIKVKLTRRLAFSDLPDALARHIATEAAVRFNRQHNRNGDLHVSCGCRPSSPAVRRSLPTTAPRTSTSSNPPTRSTSRAASVGGIGSANEL